MNRHTLVVMALCLVPACVGEPDPGDVVRPRDGAADSEPDAGTDEGLDVGGIDVGGIDVGGADSGDAVSLMDITDVVRDGGWGGCSVRGTSGACLNVDDCLPGGGYATPGYCPGPAAIQCCTNTRPATVTTDAGTLDTGIADSGVRTDGAVNSCNPTAMIQPNAGNTTEPAGLGGCPAGMMLVGTFCTDRWEATLLEVLSDGTTRSWSPYFNPGSRRVRAVSVPNAVPQGYISGTQASAACADAGKRLCTNTEWLRACRGPASYTYPYGNTRMPGVCNDARAVHPAAEYFGTGASWIYSMIQNACINQVPNGLDRTGENVGCVTAEGAFDMMGNLHEWTSDPAGTFRGGYYVDTVINGPGCLYATTAHDVGHWDYSTGFRCCANGP